jgi:hypothetical protein
MKKTKPLLLIMCFLAFTSCEKYDKAYSNKDLRFYTKDDFKTTKKITSTKLSLISDSIIFPRGIDIVNNHIIIPDKKSPKPIHAIDLNTYKYIGNYGRKGEGAGEIKSSPLIFNKDNNSFIIYDRQGKKILGYTLQSLLRDKPMFEKKINETGMCVSMCMMDNNVYYTDFLDPTYRVFKFDTIDNTTKGYGSLLNNSTGVTDMTFAQACNAEIAYRKNTAIVAYKYAPFFEIINTNTQESSSVLTLDKFPPIYKEVINNGHKIFSVLNNKTKMGFITLDTNDQYIYLLYSGKEFSSKTFYQSGNKILVFDYNGNPVDYYELDTPIFAFKVLNDKTILALTSDVTVDILKFNLDEKK